MPPGLPYTRKARTTRYNKLISLLCNLAVSAWQSGRPVDVSLVACISHGWADLLAHIRSCQEPNSPGKTVNINEYLLHFKQTQHCAVNSELFGFTLRHLYLPERIALVSHIVGQWFGLFAKTWNLANRNERHTLIIFENRI